MRIGPYKPINEHRRFIYAEDRSLARSLFRTHIDPSLAHRLHFCRRMNQIENMHVGEVEKAFVLWDMGNCPIPDGHDPLTVVAKIQMAVEKSGHVRRNGQISITAIGSKLTEIPGEDVMSRLSSFEISLKHSHRKSFLYNFF